MNLPVTGREVNYSDSANILSTTDLNGDITYVNPDFIRISGFDEQELLGQHHNVVRHPDMPPEAFADLWSCVRAGRSWMGMVKNRCKNGDHYWVSAFVTPISRDGRVVEYQSVRTKPRPEQVAAAEQLYARLRDKRPPAALRRRPLSVRSRVAALAGVAAAACAGIGGAIAGVSPGAALLLAACAALASGGLAYAAWRPCGNWPSRRAVSATTRSANWSIPGDATSSARSASPCRCWKPKPARWSAVSAMPHAS